MAKLPLITLAHSGKQHSYKVAKALQALGALERFHTSSYIRNRWLQNYLLRKGDQYWTRRFEPGLGGRQVAANWRYELREVALRKLEGKSERVQHLVYERDQQFDQHMARQLPKKNSQVFWGFQGSCWQSLQAARQCGLTSVCELATAHVTASIRLLQEEADLQPQWADSLDNLRFPAGYQQRLEEEPHLADRVVAASAFTRQTLEEVGIEAERIKVLPLGFELKHIPYLEKPPRPPDAPLKLLYAGTVTQRKGFSYLMEALANFPKAEVELHVYGGIQGSGKAFRQWEKRVHYHGPVAQQELFRLYGQFDALVLPTLFEGFGLVVVEAMAAGLPVITTPHSVGPDIVEAGKNGYIVAIRDSEALAKAIGKLSKKAPEAGQQMRRNAREAALSFTWQAYRHNLESWLKSYPWR